MAASTKSHARICLVFECEEIENSWCLVKFRDTPFISDVSERIRSNFFPVLKKNRQLELRLQSSILPQWESSELLQDNDPVTVSIVKKRKGHEAVDTINTTSRKRKQKEEQPSLLEEEYQPKTKKKKETAIISVSNPRSTTPATSTSTEPMDTKQQPADDAEVNKQDESETRLDDTPTSEDNCKKKRKRIRKHRKKKSNKFEENNLNGDGREQVVKPYKGEDVGKNEVYFGAIPDKLLAPKYYRHGYRNLNIYRPEPNKHTTFDSDEEKTQEENTEQYNFLSNTKLLEEREAYNVSMGEESEGSDSNDRISPYVEGQRNANKENETQEQLNKVNGDSEHSEKNRQESEINVHKNPIPVNTNDERVCNGYQSDVIYGKQNQTTPFKYPSSEYGYQSDTVCGNQYTATPFKHPSSEPRPLRADVTARPSQLTQKYLSSGAAVYVRERPNKYRQNGNQHFQMSKEDQLNTVATNFSTIFVNSSTPVQKEDEQLNKLVEMQNGEQETARDITPVTTYACLDYSKLPPLKGLPKTGDKIVYKILEISETCTPEMSDYKEAVVMSVDKNQMVELRNTKGATAAKKNRFHVEIEDENEILTNTANSQDVVQFHLSSLLDARMM